MSKRRVLIILITVLAVSSIVSLVAAQVVKNKIQIEKRLLTKQEKEKADATTIQEGVMSEKQRQHSKLHDKHQGLGKSIHDIVNEQIKAGNDGNVSIDTSPPNRPLTTIDNARTNILDKVVGNADAIIIGKIKKKSSQLTESGKYVFTDYELTVEDVLKDNPKSHLDASAQITVTRPGGKILLNGYVISVVNETAKPLKIMGEYILFLKFIPSTGAYLASSDEGDFQIQEGKIIPLTEGDGYAKRQEGKDAALVISEIRSAIASNLTAKRDNVNE